LLVSLAAILLNLLLVAIANKDRQIFVSFYKLEHLTTTNIYANKPPVQLIKAFFHKLDLILIRPEERRYFFLFFISRTKKEKKERVLDKMWMQGNWLSYTFMCLKISIIDLVILKVS